MNNHNKPKFVRFRELRWPDINCDLHLHTTQTDGQADIDSIMACAVERGLTRIAFTEHVRRDTPWFSEFAREVRTAQERFTHLEVLVGCEAKALDADGAFDASEKILAESDIVLGSVHRFPDGLGGFIDFASLTPDEFAQKELDLALGLLSEAPLDVLAHPGGMYARYHGDFPPHLMQRVLERSLERGIAVEINSAYIHNLPVFLEIFAEINPYVSIGSDMHILEKLGHCRDQLLDLGIGRP